MNPGFSEKHIQDIRDNLEMLFTQVDRSNRVFNLPDSIDVSLSDVMYSLGTENGYALAMRKVKNILRGLDE